jgi:choice-of-anchor B domain-containing protein
MCTPMSPGTASSPGAAIRRVLTSVVTLAGLLAPALGSAVTLRNVDLLAHFDPDPAPTPTDGTWKYSACWSYIHHDGREYAVLGGHDGVFIYNVTDPAATYPVGFVAGPPSPWREMKQYRNWIYVVTEGYGIGEGVQIIRMTDPEHPVLAATYATGFARSHTVAVDTARAILICNGTRYNAGLGAYPPSGMRVLSLADPEAPTPLAVWPNGPITTNEDSVYVHDSVPIGNRLYAASIYFGIERVFDFTNPAAPTPIAAWHYPGAFSHNSWPDKTGKWLYVTDEKNGQPLEIFDISNLAAPVLFNRFTPNPVAIVHNVHVKGDEVYLSSYTEGIRVLDATDPSHPAEFGFADSYDGPSGNYYGVWEVCPFFPSGTVIASDMETGLYVYRVRRDYGLTRVKVVDAQSGAPIAGASLFRDAGAESLVTTADGIAVFALDPGAHTVTGRLFGYAEHSLSTSASIGSRDTLTLPLSAQPRADFTGTVRGQTPIQDAQVSLAYTGLHAHTNQAGHFSLSGIPVGTYRIQVAAPGYIPIDFVRPIGPGNTSLTFTLPPVAQWDPIESADGWSVGAPGDNAVDNYTGQWQWVDPLGTVVGDASNVPSTSSASHPAFARPGAPLAHEGHREAEGLYPGPVQPEDDDTPNGTHCFVTGQGTSASDIEGYDLDGVTTLTSPTLDATSMSLPTVGFWSWFYTSTSEPGDYLDVLLSNDGGATWTLARHVTGMHDHWNMEAVRIADFMAPTAQMRVRFVASDQGGFSVVEAAIDDLVLYDGANQPVGSSPFPGDVPTRLALRAPWPNPAADRVSVVLEIPRAGHARVEVVDVQGRRVAALFDGAADAGTRVLEWDGNGAAPGIYFLRAESGGATVTTRFVKLR